MHYLNLQCIAFNAIATSVVTLVLDYPVSITNVEFTAPKATTKTIRSRTKSPCVSKPIMRTDGRTDRRIARVNVLTSNRDDNKLIVARLLYTYIHSERIASDRAVVLWFWVVLLCILIWQTCWCCCRWTFIDVIVTNIILYQYTSWNKL